MGHLHDPGLKERVVDFECTFREIEYVYVFKVRNLSFQIQRTIRKKALVRSVATKIVDLCRCLTLIKIYLVFNTIKSEENHLMKF